MRLSYVEMLVYILELQTRLYMGIASIKRERKKTNAQRKENKKKYK